jgi:hypothetical protein
MSILRIRSVYGLSTLLVLAGTCSLSWAQEPAADVVKTESPTVKKPYDEKLALEAEQKKEQARVRQLKADVVLRARFENTLWNDVELRVGDPGHRWWLRTRKTKGPELNWVRKWNLSDRNQVPEVGTWTVKNGELLMLAADNRIVARGKLDKDDEVHGEFYNPDRKQTFGSFHLIEESKRPYTLIPLHVIDPNAGK